MHSGQLCQNTGCSRGICHFCLGKFRYHVQLDGVAADGNFSMHELDSEGVAFWELVSKVRFHCFHAFSFALNCQH